MSPRRNMQLALRKRRPTLVALPLALALATSVCRPAHARSDFSALLDLEMTVDTGVITNKLGWASYYPRPADPAPPAKPGPNPTGAWSEVERNGGTANPVPNPFVAARKPKGKYGRGMTLEVGGNTDAVLADGSLGLGEGWASGRGRIRLGNMTGRDRDFPPPEDIQVDLSLTVMRALLADAADDIPIKDWASAKYIYEVVNASTGDVLVARTEVGGQDHDADPAYVLPLGVENPAVASVTIPANTFYNIDLFGHVYAAGSSEGDGVAPPIIISDPKVTEVQERANQSLPDPAMSATAYVRALAGSAHGNGSWRLGNVSGVTGDDPFARQGLNTVTVEQLATAGNSFFDLEMAVEVPVNGFSQVAIDNVLAAAGGFHGSMYSLQIGQGVNQEFQMSETPELLSLAGPLSPLAPQETSGMYHLAQANHPQSPTQVAFQGILQPGQAAQFLLAANVHDGVDGVLDGMANFTLRQSINGFGGDFNNDAVVDELDHALWASLFGGQDFLADADGSGFVDGDDLLLWQRSHGMGRSARLGGNNNLTHSVPEPTTVMSVASCLSAALVRARRRKF